jgi:Chaperone of endosialidase
MSQKLNLIRLILPLLVCLGLAPMVQAQVPYADGRVPLAPNLLNVDDVLQILDTAGDNRTQLFMGNTALPNWRMDNNLGDLQFIQFAGVGPGTQVVFREGGNVGIGTDTPTRRLNVSGSFPQFRSDSTAAVDWEFGNGGVGFWFQRTGTSGVLKLQNSALTDSLVINANGVGINTDSPAAPLHVVDPAPAPGSSIIIGEEGDLLVARSGANSVSFRLANDVRVWNFFNSFQGVYQLRDVTGGTVPFVLNPGAPSNQLVLSPGGLGINNPAPAFPIHHSSGARLTAGGVWTNASSRSLKTAFEAIDPLAVLAKVADLPVQEWRYKVEDASTRHIGPVAEDFQRLFGLGDGESIGTVDANGVALAAIQGLVQKMDKALAAKDEKMDKALAAKDAEIAELRQELRSLKDSLTDE